MAEILDPKKIRLIEWMLDKAAGTQDPKTKDELKDELGIDRKTLWRWEKDPAVDKRYRELLMQNAGAPERFGMLVDAMFTQALDGTSTKQIQAANWIKDTFGLAEQAKQDAKPQDVKTQLMGLTPEQLDEMAAQVLAEQAAKKTVERS